MIRNTLISSKNLESSISIHLLMMQVAKSYPVLKGRLYLGMQRIMTVML